MFITKKECIVMANRISLNPTSYHGAGAIHEVVNEIKAHGFKKAFVASDPDLIKFGVTAKVTDLLDKAGIAYSLYSEIKPNPTIKNVQDGVKAFKDAGCDSIITIGGGSSMDTAKAVGIIITNPDADYDSFLFGCRLQFVERQHGEQARPAHSNPCGRNDIYDSCLRRNDYKRKPHPANPVRNVFWRDKNFSNDGQ
jgi:alcohol dehydrogenase class IV